MSAQDIFNVQLLPLLLFVLSFSAFILLTVFWVFTIILGNKQSRVGGLRPTEDSYAAALKTMDEARITSLEIISKAHAKANNIISLATHDDATLNKEYTQRLSKLANYQLHSLKEFTSDFTQEYKDTVKTEADLAAASIHEVSGDLKNKLVSEAGRLMSMLGEDLLNSKDNYDNALKEAFNVARADIEVYKKGKLHDIDTRIIDIVSRAAVEVIGKAMPISEHKEVVYKILEDIKFQELSK